LHRVIGRKFERHVFPAIPPNWTLGAWKASQARKVLLYNIETKRPIYVTPYALTGYSREESLTSDNAELSNEKMILNGGIDLKLGLSTNYTLDISLNTDFAQVEADNFQANLTRFSLFFPEKRQFFQERASIFNFTLSGSNRLFNSRVIGLSDNGTPIPVLGGIRLVGRSKGLDLGLLNMITEGAHDSLGLSNFSVLRVKKRVINKNSFLGGIVTSQINNKVGNVAYGIDLVTRLRGQLFLTAKAGQSLDKLFKAVKDNSFFHVNLTKRATKGLGYSMGLERIADEFNPKSGFIQRKNILAAGSISYGYFHPTSLFLRSVTPIFTTRIFLRNSDHTLETINNDVQLLFSLKSGASSAVAFQKILDVLLDPFTIGKDYQIAAGTYNLDNFKIEFNTNQGRRLRVSLAAGTGTYYGGNQSGFSIAPSWNPSKYLEMRISYSANKIWFVDPAKTIWANIGSLNAIVAYNTQWSLSMLGQYNSLTNKLGLNCRIRFNQKEGNDLFIVFNSVNTVDPDVESVNPLNPVSSWSLKLKFTHTFRL
jgi:hypothetical protein